MTTTFFLSAFSLPFALLEIGEKFVELDAKADLVGGDQVVERLQHAFGFIAGRCEFARFVDAGGDEDRIML